MVYGFLSYYPPFLALVFLLVLMLAKRPAKGQFLARSLVALVIAIVLAHLNRWIGLYPAYLFFPSGHTTFCLGVSISLAMLWPRSLIVTLPLVILLGVGLVNMGYHTWFDVLGAIPLVAIVYGLIHRFWKMSTVPESARLPSEPSSEW